VNKIRKIVRIKKRKRKEIGHEKIICLLFDPNALEPCPMGSSV